MQLKAYIREREVRLSSYDCVCNLTIICSQREVGLELLMNGFSAVSIPTKSYREGLIRPLSSLL